MAYATRHGSTREVADVVAQTLAASGLQVVTSPAAGVDDLSPYFDYGKPASEARDLRSPLQQTPR